MENGVELHVATFTLYPLCALVAPCSLLLCVLCEPIELNVENGELRVR